MYFKWISHFFHIGSLEYTVILKEQLTKCVKAIDNIVDGNTVRRQLGLEPQSPTFKADVVAATSREKHTIGAGYVISCLCTFNYFRKLFIVFSLSVKRS